MSVICNEVNKNYTVVKFSSFARLPKLKSNDCRFLLSMEQIYRYIASTYISINIVSMYMYIVRLKFCTFCECSVMAHTLYTVCGLDLSVAMTIDIML